MTMPLSLFIEDLEAAANTASRAEDEFRRTIATRIRTLETERAFAFRRLNLMREVADAVTAAEDEAAAVGRAATALRARLGWASDSDARREVVDRFAPVARAMFGQPVPVQAEGMTAEVVEVSVVKVSVADISESSVPVAEVSMTEALAAFEAWYAATHPVPFWVLFENVMPETPVVDF